MQHISKVRVKDKTQLSRQGDQPEPYEQMVYAQPRICLGEWEAQTPLWFWHTNGSPNLGQTARPYDNQQKLNLQICGLGSPGCQQTRIESQKKDKYLDLALELKKLWNMNVTIIPIVVGALGTVTKGLVKGLEDLEIRGRVERIQTKALLRSAGILRRVLEIWGDLLSLGLQWKTIS